MSKRPPPHSPAGQESVGPVTRLLSALQDYARLCLGAVGAYTPVVSAPATPTPQAPPISASAVVEALSRSIAALSDRQHALIRRFAASFDTLAEDAALLLAGVSAAGWETVSCCSARQLALYAEKAWEGAAEEVRVRAAQLEASAQVLEREAEEESGESVGMSVTAVARALLSSDDHNSNGFSAVDWDCKAALLAVDTALRVRDGVHPTLCAVSGDGLLFYSAADNCVTVTAVDGEGDVVESIEAGDVCVSVEGARLASVSVGEAGHVEVVYNVPEGSVGPVTVGMSVCGVAGVMPGSPWTVTCTLGDSAILASVAPERLAAFLRELSAWLPRRAYTLLYRGSRDGMTAASFHGLCDGKGPTLVLVRCDMDWVFGGYAGASWESPPSGGESIGSGDAFLFSVTGPYTSAPVRLPVKADKADEALYFHAGCGPCFSGLCVSADSRSPADCFDKRGSGCVVGEDYSCFDDVIGKGNDSLTGAVYFLPVDVEVYSVTNAYLR